MAIVHTAIIHLRRPSMPRSRGILEPLLRVLRGVHQVDFEPSDALITVSFDDELTNLADLVRTIEDAGSGVQAVAQRSPHYA